MTVLEELADYAKERTRQAKRKISPEQMRGRALELPKGTFAFEKALKKPELSFICECKKASPSKGVIASDFPYQKIAREYEAAGADCISVLTEPRWFLGSDRYLEEIVSMVKIPCIRKDFTVDEYMIYQAKALGASAVLLICSLLDDVKLRNFYQLTKELHMDALVEAHDEKEVLRALDCGAKIIGVNNRDLKTFQVDTGNSIRLRKIAPVDAVFVSESGIRTSEDIHRLRENDIQAVLIGETLLRSPDKRKALEHLNGGPLCQK